MKATRSAAPVAISGNATVLVLAPQGYQTAVGGSNGFTWCRSRRRSFWCQ